MPAVSETISIAPRIGTPLLTSVENVRAKRDSATFLNSTPNTGSRSITWSITKRPFGVLQATFSPNNAAPRPPKIRYQ